MERPSSKVEMQQPQQTEKVIHRACLHPLLTLTDKLSPHRDNRGLIVGICVV